MKKRVSQIALSRLYKSHLSVGSGVDDLASRNIETRLNRYGLYEPTIKNGDITEAELESALAVSLNSQYSESEDSIAKRLYAQLRDISHDDIVGYHLDLYAGYVKESTFRKGGSSGGFASWIAVELLKKNKVDGFIHVKKANTGGTLFEYGISRSVDEIRSGAKSRYYPVELSKVLKQVKKSPGKYAIVGIPEVLTEVRLLSEKDKVIRDRIVYYIGLVCGHQKSTKYAEAIAWECGIQPGDLSDIDFREKQNSGRAIDYNMRVTGLIRGKEKSFSIGQATSFVSNWGHGFFKAKFSDFTDNVFNDVADVVVGDAWLEEYVNDPKGTNILIVRHPDIAEMLRKAVSEDRLKLDRLTVDDVKRSQEGLIHHLRDELPYRLQKLKSKKKYTPIKRVPPSGQLDVNRKKVQDIRQTISRRSHVLYEEAVNRNDFDYFKKSMQKYLDAYERLYSPKPSKKFNLIKPRPLIMSTIRIGVNMPSRIKERNADGAILSLTGYSNYGNVVQRYALQKFLKKNGLNYISLADSFHHAQANYVIPKKVIIKTPLRFVKRVIKGIVPYWYIPPVEELFPEVSRFKSLITFANKNIWQKPSNQLGDNNYRNYVVGSDQVWRNWYGPDTDEEKRKAGYYFLNFLKDQKTNRVAYAASFGKDSLSEVLSDDFIQYVKPYVKKFNGISVREKSAIAMTKNAWDVSGVVEVLDPTLLLCARDYSSLLKKSKIKGAPSEKLFFYILDMSKEKSGLLSKVEKALGEKFWGINPDGEKVLPPVEWWLKGFRDADFVVTDSFHGTVFSILNETPFVVVGNEGRGLSRLTDLLEGIGLEQRIIPEDKLDNFVYGNFDDIDWGVVRQRLTKKKEYSANWLISHLSK